MDLIEFTPLSPSFLTIWPVSLHYYWLMYAVSFLFAYSFIKKLIIKYRFAVNEEIFERLFFWIIICWLIWWRLGHVLFYDFQYFSENLVEIFYVWNGWMASHWWIIGGLIWFMYFKPKNINTLKFLDLIVLPLPIWLALWRLWNLINWELYGKVTSMPWCMKFADEICRHPTQIYAVIKNLIIFGILFYLYKKFKFSKPWILASAFLISYGILRIIVEFYKESFIWNNYLSFLTTGQILSCLMVLFWLLLWISIIRRSKV